MNRHDLAALPIDELTRQADTALRATAERYGWAPRRARGLPVAMLVQIVMTAQLRAELG
jgi:hypothetical protein